MNQVAWVARNGWNPPESLQPTVEQEFCRGEWPPSQASAIALVPQEQGGQSKSEGACYPDIQGTGEKGGPLSLPVSLQVEVGWLSES